MFSRLVEIWSKLCTSTTMSTSQTFSSTSVPCTCPDSTTGSDGLDHFDLCECRCVSTLAEVVEPGWHCISLDLQLPPGSPIVIVPRVGHALVPVTSKSQIWMIGGGNQEGALTEVWKIDYSGSSSWELDVDAHLSLDFPGRYEFFSGINKVQDKIWVFGGADVKDTNNDVLYLEVETCTVVEVAPPPKLVNTIFGKTREAEEGSNDPDVDVPAARTQGNNSCVMDLNGVEHLVIFGGGVGKEKSVADKHLYTFNTSTRAWNRVEVRGSNPVPVQGHSMVAIGSKVYLFGGMENMRLYNDFFTIDLLTTQDVKWVKIRTSGSKPAPRAAHGVTTVGTDMYIFGGVGQYGSLADLWKFDTEAQKWTLIDPGTRHLNKAEKRFEIQPRLDMGMTSVTVMVSKDTGGYEPGNVLVINGGMNTMGHLFDDTWIFPLYKWDKTPQN